MAESPTKTAADTLDGDFSNDGRDTVTREEHTTRDSDAAKSKEPPETLLIEDDTGVGVAKASGTGGTKDPLEALVIEDDTGVGIPKDLEASSAPQPPKPPDGGLEAWTVVFAGFCLAFSSIGLRDSIGVYQRYFVLSDTFPGSSSFAVSFIGAIASAVWGMFGPIMSVFMNKYGFRPVAMGGSFLLLVSYMLASFASALWVLYITQGFMVGVAWAGMYLPAQAGIPGWFVKRRGLGVGVAIMGSGVGGFVAANYTQAVLSSLGWANALRINGAVSGVIGMAAGWFVRPFNVKPNPNVRFKLTSFFDPSYFKGRQFNAFWAMGLLQCFAFYLPYIFLAQFGASIGLNGSQAALASSMMSVGSTVGRFLLPLVSDYTGPLNMWTVSQVLCAVLFLCLPVSRSFGSLIAFAISYGLMTGGFVSLYPVCIAKVLGNDNLGGKMGMVYTSFVIGTLAGAPIGGALIDSNTVFGPNGERLSTNWWPMCIYGFAVTMGSLFFVVWLRFEGAKWRFFALV